jgi:bifunctional DNA-binding transcriptional regulator/antitoxin component of YhaV-PrlF toxin-antitoxin module
MVKVKVDITMTVTVKDKTPLTVPDQVRRRAGFKQGDQVEFKVSGGIIKIVPKLQSADEEYTSEQRRIIDAQLAEGLADIKAGRTLGPFESADQMIVHMKAQLKKRAIPQKTKRSR